MFNRVPVVATSSQGDGLNNTNVIMLAGICEEVEAVKKKFLRNLVATPENI